MEPVIIPLDPPLEYGQEQLKELRIERKPKASDLLNIDLQALYVTNNILTVAERLTGIPAGILGQMDMAALDSLVTVLTRFYAPGRTTGQTG